MKCICRVLMLPLLVFLAGCSSQDFGRPIARIGDVVDSGKAYIKDGSDEEGLRRAAQLAQILAEWERQKGAVDEDYTLGADDVLTIGVLSLEAPEKVSELTRTVSKDGTVTLPLIGSMVCAGKTARQFQLRVIAAYKGRYLQDPQVDVAVAEYRSAPVVVTGAVDAPGVYYLRHNRSSVLEVLSMANGLSAKAGNDLLIVRRRDAPAAQDDARDQAETNLALLPVRAPEPLPTPPPEPWTGSHIVDRVNRMAAEEDARAEDAAWTGSHIVDRVADLEDQAEADAAAPGEAAVDQRVVEAIAAASDDGAGEDRAGVGVIGDASAMDADLITVDLEGLLDEGDIRLNLPIMGGDIVTVPPGREEYVYVLGYVQRPGAFELHGRRRVRALQAVAMAGGLSSAARAQNSFLIIDKPSGRKVVPVDLTKIARGQRPPVYMESGHTLVIGSGVFARLAEFIKPSVSAGANLTPGP